MSLLREIPKLLRTVRHIPVSQLFWFFYRRFLRLPRSAPTPKLQQRREATVLPRPIAPPAPVFESPLNFRFLADSHNFTDAINWRSTGKSKLWRYNLHYFDWFRQPDVNRELALEHATNWIEANSPFSGDGWEPYPTSVRLVNWVTKFAGGPVPDTVRDSIALQGEWLSRNLELHIRANHLLSNVIALFYVAAFFDGNWARQIARLAEQHFARELEEQFLADGGHFEGSPMYHAMMTRDLVELSVLLEAHGSLLSADLASRLRDVTVQALEFLRVVTAPNGSLLRFNDSVDGIAPSRGDIEGYAARNLGLAARPGASSTAATSCPDSGIFVCRSGTNMVAIKCADARPRYQPGHAHCDILSFEYFQDGARMIGNCGVYDYENDMERLRARSTASHNTASVDHGEQHELWGAFRVGRRATTDVEEFTSGPEGTVFTGSHNGFSHLRGKPVHRRSLAVSRNFDIVIIDELLASGAHELTQHIHLEPGYRATIKDSTVDIESEGLLCARIETEAKAGIEVLETSRYPGFGLVEAAHSVVISIHGNGNQRLTTRVETSVSS